MTHLTATAPDGTWLAIHGGLRKLNAEVDNNRRSVHQKRFSTAESERETGSIDWSYGRLRRRQSTSRVANWQMTVDTLRIGVASLRHCDQRYQNALGATSRKGETNTGRPSVGCAWVNRGGYSEPVLRLNYLSLDCTGDCYVDSWVQSLSSAYKRWVVERTWLNLSWWCRRRAKTQVETTEIHLPHMIRIMVRPVSKVDLTPFPKHLLENNSKTVENNQVENS